MRTLNFSTFVAFYRHQILIAEYGCFSQTQTLNQTNFFFSDKNFKSWRPNISVPTNSSHTVAGDSIKQNHQLVRSNTKGQKMM